MFLLYVKVNDIQMYYDIQGDGEPLEGTLFNVDPPATEEDIIHGKYGRQQL